MDFIGTIRLYLRWLLFGLLEICGVRMWDNSRKGVGDDEVAADLGLDKRIETETKSLSLTKEQVDTIRQRSVRVTANRKADTP
jgi:hypothetical protein